MNVFIMNMIHVLKKKLNIFIIHNQNFLKTIFIELLVDIFLVKLSRPLRKHCGP